MVLDLMGEVAPRLFRDTSLVQSRWILEARSDITVPSGYLV